MKHSNSSDAVRRNPRDVVGMLQRVPGFDQLIVLLQFELAEARQRYEDQPASELNRGQVKGITAVLDLLTTGTKQ